MPKFICETCGTQYAETEAPPSDCAICEDKRQYIGWSGQQWTTHDELVGRFGQRIEEEDGLLAIGLPPKFAIDQRALLLPTDAGNILWETVSAVTDEAVEAINKRGGLDRIIISHPHFYAAMTQWSDAFGGVPITLNAADKKWVNDHHCAIEFWEGEAFKLSSAVTLLRVGGHFDGSTVLHWADGPRSGGALFSGDALQVVMTRRHVSFMRSYPNLLPMRTSDVRAMRALLQQLEFEDVFGYTWGLNIIGGGRAAVDLSFDRYLKAVTS